MAKKGGLVPLGWMSDVSWMLKEEDGGGDGEKDYWGVQGKGLREAIASF